MTKPQNIEIVEDVGILDKVFLISLVILLTYYTVLRMQSCLPSNNTTPQLTLPPDKQPTTRKLFPLNVFQSESNLGYECKTVTWLDSKLNTINTHLATVHKL